MPAKYQPISTNRLIGGVCDCCGKDTELAEFALSYHFDYGTTLDGTTVNAYLCNKCLAKIIVDNIPNAIFSGYRKIIPHSKIKEWLANET